MDVAGGGRMGGSSTDEHGRKESLKASDPGPSTDDVGPSGAGRDDSDAESLPRGSNLGRYLLLDQLGAGAMGVVYGAYDPELDRKIAIKLLRSAALSGDRPRRRERLVREARAMAKLSHPNVGAIFDVGVHEGQVFLAMEYLPGGTLRSWLAAEKRTWRQIVRVFVEVGRGLSAAHAEGLIHRDFKPDNVLFDKAEKPKVVDFGLVRLADSSDISASGELPASELPLADATTPISPRLEKAVLTRTGALAGTPAYMAPEQFLGKAIDGRADQFAFCVALYEALYQVRPFPGDTLLSLADSVTSGKLDDPPKNAQVPIRVRRALLRGLRLEPAERHPDFAHLLDALTADRFTRLSRRVAVGAVITAALASAFVVAHRSEQRRHEIDRQVAEHLAITATRKEGARQSLSRYSALSHDAFGAFDDGRQEEGERLWDEARAAAAEATNGYQEAAEHAESATSLSRSDLAMARLRATLAEFLLGAERMGAGSLSREIARRLDPLATPSERTTLLHPVGLLDLGVFPPDVAVTLDRYLRRPDGTDTLSVIPAGRLGQSPVSLDSGSYRLTISRQGTTVRYPFVVGRDEALALKITVKRWSLPKGVVLVPAGRFLYGDADEELREAFLKTSPLHESSTGSFLIGKAEVTYRDWIAFLEADGRDRDSHLLPNVSERRGSTLGGSVRLFRDANGTWTVALAPSTVEYRAIAGQPIRYAGRTVRAVQDWLSLPVTGVSPQDMEEYLDWLSRSGRLVGARFCTEREWERAARGGDDRIYPHGYTLNAGDANHDVTYGRVAEAFGPDQICSYPGSNSPFDLCDMAGNVLEVTRSPLAADAFTIRGGGYYFFRNSERLTNREPFLRSSRSVHVGFRVCADANDVVDVTWHFQQRALRADPPRDGI